MKTVDIQTRKLNLIEDISRLNAPSVLDKVEQLLRDSRKSAYEQQLKPLAASEFQNRLEASEAAIKSGRVISQEDLEQEAENW